MMKTVLPEVGAVDRFLTAGFLRGTEELKIEYAGGVAYAATNEGGEWKPLDSLRTKHWNIVIARLKVLAGIEQIHSDLTQISGPFAFGVSEAKIRLRAIFVYQSGGRQTIRILRMP